MSATLTQDLDGQLSIFKTGDNGEKDSNSYSISIDTISVDVKRLQAEISNIRDLANKDPRDKDQEKYFEKALKDKLDNFICSLIEYY